MKVNVPTTTHLTFCMAIFDYKIVLLTRGSLFSQQCNQFDSTPRSSAKSSPLGLVYLSRCAARKVSFRLTAHESNAEPMAHVAVKLLKNERNEKNVAILGFFRADVFLDVDGDRWGDVCKTGGRSEIRDFFILQRIRFCAHISQECRSARLQLWPQRRGRWRTRICREVVEVKSRLLR